MKKLLFLSALFLFLLTALFLTPRPASAQSCVGDYQSCDQNNPCCNFPGFACQGGYCQPPFSQCGTNTLPCCNPPSQLCETGLACQGNYCVVHAQPSPSPAPKPSIPTPSAGGGNDVLCPDGASIDTAIGCIPLGGEEGETAFIGFILSWAIGVGGGVAFLLMLFAGFQIMTSAGNPDRLRAGQELLTSAVSGLILLIFSVFILRTIGIDILGITRLGQ